jgi:hypothetical protein
VNDGELEVIRARPPYSLDEAAVDGQRQPTLSAEVGETERRRKVRWGERPFAEVCLGVVGSLAVAGWLAAGMLILIVVDDRNGPEGMTGLVFVFGMPVLLVVAFGFTAIAAFTWHRFWGGRFSLVVSIVTTASAAVVPCGWLLLVPR